jgi:hypothetical protein
VADWTREFDDPIPVSKGRQLVTLREAAVYIQKLPEAEQLLEEWQAAVEALLLVVELNVHALVFPCHKDGAEWVDASDKKHVDIQPTQWRKWTERN